LVQASLEELPFAGGVFDACYCIGVIQHTPDPRRALKSLPRLLKPDGLFAVTIYERRRWTLLHMKYLIRPITKRFRQTTLLSLIKVSMPVLFPLTEICYRLPLVGRLFAFIIPVANYVDEPELRLQQRYQWAVLDTFDMLSPQYDQPQNRNQVIADLQREGIVDIKEPSTGGLNIIGRKAAGPA
jgi:SAM-dependent methyltransferase